MPVYFLWGDEDFLIEKRARQIKKDVLKGDANEFNFRSVDNPSFSLFSELIRTNAMMFGDTVIQIKCPKYFLETKQKEKLDEKQVKELIDGLNNISDKIHLILICPTPRGEKKKPDSRKKLYKELVKLTKPEEFPSFRNYEEGKIIPVVQKMAKELSIKINPPEISLLIQTSGTSLRDLNNQLEKLKLFAYPNDVITSDMINEVAIHNVDVFNIIDLILSKKWANAIDLISQILQKEHYLPSLALMQTMISNLIRTKIYSNSMSTFDIAIKLNQNEFVVKNNIKKLSNINLKALVDLKLNLLKAEYCLKSGTVKEPLTAYEMAFMGNFEGIKL